MVFHSALYFGDPGKLLGLEKGPGSITKEECLFYEVPDHKAPISGRSLQLTSYHVAQDGALSSEFRVNLAGETEVEEDRWVHVLK